MIKMKPSQDRIDIFFNALQLSVDCQVFPVGDVTPEQMKDPRNILFIGVDHDKDTRFTSFTRIISGRWLNHNTYSIDDIDTALSQEFINFLMLSRLKEENMQKLAEIDRQYTRFTTKLGLGAARVEDTVGTIEEARRFLFSVVAQKTMTLRELAEKSGMTQTALSNFKRGSSIRLDNFLNLCRVLGLKVGLWS